MPSRHLLRRTLPLGAMLVVLALEPRAALAQGPAPGAEIEALRRELQQLQEPGRQFVSKGS